jgi:hypothetical protein
MQRQPNLPCAEMPRSEDNTLNGQALPASTPLPDLTTHDEAKEDAPDGPTSSSSALTVDGKTAGSVDTPGKPKLVGILKPCSFPGKRPAYLPALPPKSGAKSVSFAVQDDEIPIKDTQQMVHDLYVCINNPGESSR